VDVIHAAPVHAADRYAHPIVGAEDSLGRVKKVTPLAAARLAALVTLLFKKLLRLNCDSLDILCSPVGAALVADLGRSRPL
jgi:hypothetical protein